MDQLVDVSFSLTFAFSTLQQGSKLRIDVLSILQDLSTRISTGVCVCGGGGGYL